MGGQTDVHTDRQGERGSDRQSGAGLEAGPKIKASKQVSNAGNRSSLLELHRAKASVNKSFDVSELIFIL